MPLPPVNTHTINRSRYMLGSVDARPVPGAYIPRVRVKPTRSPMHRLGASVLAALGFDTSWIEPAIEATVTTTAAVAEAAKKSKKSHKASTPAQSAPAPVYTPAPASSSVPAWALPAALAGGAVVLAVVLSRPSAPPVSAPALARANPRRRRRGGRRG